MDDNTFLVVKDEDGILRPMAGIWRNDTAGNHASAAYADRDSGVTIVEVELKEVA